MSILDNVRQTIKAKWLAGEDTSRMTLSKADLWDLHEELYRHGIMLYGADDAGNKHIVSMMSPAGVTKFYPEDPA